MMGSVPGVQGWMGSLRAASRIERVSFAVWMAICVVGASVTPAQARPPRERDPVTSESPTPEIQDDSPSESAQSRRAAERARREERSREREQERAVQREQVREEVIQDKREHIEKRERRRSEAQEEQAEQASEESRVEREAVREHEREDAHSDRKPPSAEEAAGGVRESRERDGRHTERSSRDSEPEASVFPRPPFTTSVSRSPEAVTSEHSRHDTRHGDGDRHDARRRGGEDRSGSYDRRDHERDDHDGRHGRHDRHRHDHDRYTGYYRYGYFDYDWWDFGYRDHDHWGGHYTKTRYSRHARHTHHHDAHCRHSRVILVPAFFPFFGAFFHPFGEFYCGDCDRYFTSFDGFGRHLHGVHHLHGREVNFYLSSGVWVYYH